MNKGCLQISPVFKKNLIFHGEKGGRTGVMDNSRKGCESSAGEAGERSLFKDWFHGSISSSSVFPGAYLVCMHKNPFLVSPLNSFPLYNFLCI